MRAFLDAIYLQIRTYTIKSKEIALCLSVILLTIIKTYSQSIEIYGRVQSTDGKAIPYANVSLLVSTTDSLFINATQSDSNGAFRITAKDSRNILVINSFGYKRYFSSVNVSYPLNVTLQTESIKLDEIVVKANAPIVIKKDTAAFSVKNFSDKTELSIEEVIKKLPGMTVSSNGTIYFNGRSIDKILINGEEFFAKNYKLLSKNISPKMVAVIEAITNYSEQPLLAGINPSEKSVLNLKLENENSIKIISESKLGTGIANRFTINTTNFAFLKNIKLGIIGNINNTNQDIFSDISDNIFVQNLPFRHNYIDIQLPISNARPYIPGVTETRYLDKLSKLGAIQFNKKFNDNFKIKISSYIYGEKTKNSFVSKNYFIYGDSINKVSTYGLSTTSWNSGVASMNTELKFSSNSLLVTNTSISLNNPRISNRFDLSNNLNKDSVQSNSMEPAMGIDAQVNYIKKFKSTSALQISSSYYANNSEQNLYLESPLYRLVINSIDTQKLIQRFNIQQYNSVSRVEYFSVLNSHHLSFAASINNYYSKLNSSLTNQVVTYRHYQNDLVYKDLYKELMIKDIFEKNIFKVITSVILHHGTVSFNDTAAVDKNVFFVQPALNIKINVLNTHKIDFELLYDNQQAGPTDLYKSLVFEDYINANNNNYKFNIIHHGKLFFNYSYLNRENYFNAMVNVVYNIRYNPYAVYYRSREFINLSTRTPYSGNNSDLTVKSTVGKLLHGVKTRVQLTNTFSYFALSRLSAGNTFFKATIYNEEVSTSFVTPITHTFSVGFEPKWIYRILENQGIDSKFKSNQFRTNVFISAEPTSGLVVKVLSENIVWENNITSFLDASLVYSFNEKKNYSIEIRGTNLLNSRSIEFNTLSTNLFSSTVYSITPRILYASIKFGIGN